MTQRGEKRKIRTIELNNKIELLRDSLYYIEFICHCVSMYGVIAIRSSNPTCGAYYGFFNDLDKVKSEIANIQHEASYYKMLKYRKLKNNYNSSDLSCPELCYRPSPLTIDLSPQLDDDVIELINDFTGLDYVFVITDEEISGKIPRVMLRDQNVPEEKEVHKVILNKLSKRKPRITYQTSMSKAPLSLYHHNL